MGYSHDYPWNSKYILADFLTREATFWWTVGLEVGAHRFLGDTRGIHACVQGAIGSVQGNPSMFWGDDRGIDRKVAVHFMLKSRWACE
jgi:hypothetical protein